MLRIRLIENRTGEYNGLDVFASEVPVGQTLTLNLSDDVVREFYIEAPGDWVFVQDGPGGIVSLSHVNLAVTETLVSYASMLRAVEGRTES